MTPIADLRVWLAPAQMFAKNVVSAVTMRGAALVISIFAVCGFCLAQKVTFAAAEKSIILEHMQDAPASDGERAARIRILFVEAGCSGNSLQDQPVEGGVAPNIICQLRGEGDETVVVGAHYERTSGPGPSIDNWSGASLLPALYKCLRENKRHHNFVFVAFADQGSDQAGAKFFAGHLSPSEIRRTEAMVNLDALGFSPTKVWTSHSDKDLVHALVVMAYALKLPASQVDMENSDTTDSDPFASRQIPRITIHSLTQQNLTGGLTTPFRPNNFYDTYRLLCGYLAYLDGTLKPRPHPE